LIEELIKSGRFEMAEELKGINFGEIDHFLYVKINSVCVDLGYSVSEFIEEACDQFFRLVDEQGITRFLMLAEERQRYREAQEKTAYLPRMQDQKHAFVVKVREEVHEYLNCVRHENKLTWGAMLNILYMLIELKMNKEDDKEWKDWLAKKDNELISKAFSDLRLASEDYNKSRIDKTDLRRAYEKKAGICPERASFRSRSD
jgi:hypothetical protein